ncbi:MAG: peptidoglycan editing factor PgeF [Bacillota bacterium]|nr:peptidoglycan editing factor PgeF [Bacillota bacterium]
MWQKAETNNLIYYTLPHWQDLGANVYVSCRLGGVSVGGFSSLNLARHTGDDPDAVTENRRRFFAAVKADPKDFVALQQTHSCNIVRVSSADRGKGLMEYETAIADTDAMYTVDANVFMATFYADCLPIALFDPKNRVLALVHSGWRGTWQNIAAAAVTAMSEDCRSEPENILAAFGPGICQSCYEVDSGFYQNFLGAYPHAEPWFKSGKNGKYYFDNAAANRDLLTAAGVLEKNITNFPFCTACNKDMFYSFRFSQQECGRHGLFGQLIKST